jgi:hypothetical protein
VLVTSPCCIPVAANSICLLIVNAQAGGFMFPASGENTQR